MKKNKFLRTFFALLLGALLTLGSLTSCEAAAVNAPIFQDVANKIDGALRTALNAEAAAREDAADAYEASGEVLENEAGEPIDMTAYIAKLRSDATLLRGLSYDAYQLAIMDNLFSLYYINPYQSVVTLAPDIAYLVAEYGNLPLLTDSEITTELITEAYFVALDEIFAGFVNTETAKLETENASTFVGVGVSVTPRHDGYIDIISVFAGSPAYDADIMVGDVLIAVDGVDVTTKSYNEIISMVRGEENTAVSLTLTREGVPYTVSVTRKMLQAVTVTYKLLPEGTGKTALIRLSEFSKTTFTEFVAAVTAAEAEGATSLIFDVRNNPGGDLEAVLGILEYILPDTGTAPLIRMETKYTSQSYYSVEDYIKGLADYAELAPVYAPAKNHEITARMAVLCNGNTASAGELFASCLMDLGIAEVYGETTYGKGLGQFLFPLSDEYMYRALGQEGYSVKEEGYFVIPAFFYCPPISENYHGVGVVPHHTVSLPDEAKDYYVTNLPTALDSQLLAAIAFVQGTDPVTQPSVQAPDNTPDNTPENPDNTPTAPKVPVENSFFPLGAIIFTVIAAAVGVAIAVIVFFTHDYKRQSKHPRNDDSGPDER